MPRKDANLVIRGDDKTGKAFRSVRSNIKGLAKTLGPLIGTVAGVAGVRGFGLIATNALKSADSIGKVADKVALTTNELQELRFASELAGVEQRALDMGMQRFSRRIAEVVAGTGELKPIIEQYGIALTDAEGRQRAQIDILRDYADVIANTESEQEQLRLSFKAFDSEGAALVNMLRRGSTALDEQRQLARDYGAVLDEEVIRNSERAQDALTLMGTAISTSVTAAFVELAPAIEAVAIEIANLVRGDTVAGTILERTTAFLTAEIEAAEQGVATLEQLVEAKRAAGGAYQVELGILEQERNLLRQARDEFAEFQLEKAAAAEADQVAGAAVGLTDQEKKQLDAKVETLGLSLLNEELQLQESLLRRADMVTLALENDLISDARAQSLVEGLTAQHQAKLTAITTKGFTDRQKFAAMSSSSQTKQVIGELVNMTAGVASSSKAMFKINQVAGIANAIISTHESITKTMGAYPYPINVALAALSGAAGFAQVNAIRSASFGGGGGAGTTPSVAGSIPTLNGQPVGDIPSLSAPDQQSPEIHITVVGANPDGTVTMSLDGMRSFAEDLLRGQRMGVVPRVLAEAS